MVTCTYLIEGEPHRDKRINQARTNFGYDAFDVILIAHEDFISEITLLGQANNYMDSDYKTVEEAAPALEAFMRAGKRNELETAQLEAATAKAELAQADETLVNVLADARKGLVPAPVQGEEWDKAKRYIAGDLVMSKGIAYIAERFSQGKAPADHPDCWMVKPDVVTYPLWTEIPDGTVIEEGARCVEAGKTWECIMQHIKSTVYKPKAGSTRWKEIISLEVRNG